MAEFWSVKEVANWLASIGMEEFIISFTDQQINGEDLAELTEFDMIELGMTTVGIRKKFKRKIDQLFDKDNFDDFDSSSRSSHSLGESSRTSFGSWRSTNSVTKVKCKFVYHKDIRVINIKPTSNLRKVKKKVKAEYHRSLDIYWKNENKERIFVSSSKILQGILQSVRIDETVRFTLKRSSERKRDKRKSKKIDAKKPEKNVSTTPVNAKPSKAELDKQFQLFEALLDACIVTTDDGYIKYFNKSAEKLFGFDRSELIGKPLTSLMPPMYAARHDGYMKKYLQTKESSIMGTSRHVLAVHKTGYTMVVDLGLSENFISGDRYFIGILKFIQRKEDVTFFSIFDSLLDVIVCIDSVGKIIYANSKAIAFFGHPKNILIGSNINTLMPSPHKENHDRYLSEYLKTGRSTIIGTTRNTVCEMADGSIVPIALSVTENSDPSGRKYFTGTFTQRVSTRKVTSILNQQRIFVENLAAPTIIVNSYGIIQAFNQSALAIFGYTLDEILGQNISLIVNQNHADKHDSYLEAYRKTGTSSVIGASRNVALRKKNQREITASLNITEFKEEDGSVFFVGMLFHQ